MHARQAPKCFLPHLYTHAWILMVEVQVQMPAGLGKRPLLFCMQGNGPSLHDLLSPPPTRVAQRPWGGGETPIQKSMFFYGTSPGFSDFISREFLPRTPNFMHDLTQKPNCNTGHKGTPLVETGCLHGPHSLHRTTVLWVSWFLQSVYPPSCPRPFPHSSCLLLKD